MPLRSILEDFLNYVAKVDDAATTATNGEQQQQPQADHYEKEFQELKVLTEEIRAQNSCSCGEKEVNRRKNRYKDILPYDFNRVTLSEVPGVADSDYINASYIKGASGSKAYIASQAPLPHTVEDFWKMIFETDVQVVVMASNEIEAGRPKCERYWPNEGEEKVFGNITITLEQQREMCEDFKVKRLKAKMGDSPPRTLHHFHYHNWPDHGVPTSVTAILDMVELIRRDFQPSETLPVLVHCSAGCGRTGTVCAIDYVWGLLRTGKLNEEFSLKQLILELRRQRIAMVQTKEQYVLVHRAVKELFERHLKVIDDHPYENVDFSGQPLGLKDEPDYANIIKDDINPYENVMMSCSANCSDGGEDGGRSERSRSLRSVDKAGTEEDDGRVVSLERPPPFPKATVKAEHGAADVKPPSFDNGGGAGTNRDPAPIPCPQTKLEYVNDWCAGIGVLAERDKESSPQPQQTDDASRVDIKRLSVSGGSTASSSTTSLARYKASGGGFTHRERPIVSLVRKPSIAKLRELFSGNANSDSSSPPSPEGLADSPSPRLVRRERAATDPLINDDPSGKDNEVTSGGSMTQSLVKLKRRIPRHSKNYVDDNEYERLVSRYMDVSLQIFKDNKQFVEDERRDEMRDSQLQLKLLQVSPSLSASSEGMIGTTTASSNVSTGNPSLSSPLLTRDSDQRSLSPATLRHSPSPGHSSSPSPRERSEKVSDFVGRLVRSRRNSAAEKRSSTWYDEMPCNEDDVRATEDLQQPTPTSRLTQFFGGDRKSSSPEEKSSAASVKRSISMKVGFGSPFIRRRRNPQTDVAAYLAVEENRKNNNKDNNKMVVEADKSSVVDSVEAKSNNPMKQSKLNRKLHGYVNVKPVQNSRYITGGGPVELKNFSPCGEDGVNLRTSDGMQRPPNVSPLPARRRCFPVVVPSASEEVPVLSTLGNSPMLCRRNEGNPVVGRQSPASPSQKERRRFKADSPQRAQVPVTSDAMRTFGADDRHQTKVMMRHQNNSREATEDSLIDHEVSEVVQRLERELRKRSSVPSHFPMSSLQQKAEPRSSKKRIGTPSGKDDLYGAEMDEYCQKMLEDCRDYLLTHHYSNLTDEARHNIRWIEDTIHKSPRHAIMDVTSSTEKLFSDAGETSPGRSRLSSGPHNYEKLWLSRSGRDESSDRRESAEEGDCSVDEATIDFPPQYEDEEDGDVDCGGLSKSQWFHYENLAPSRTNFDSSSPPLGRCAPKDPKFSHTVEELQTLIDELEVDASEKKRKPHPAPRTVLNVSSSRDAVARHGQKEMPDSRVHVYDNVCESIQPKIEHQNLLGSSNVGYTFAVDRGSDRCNRFSVQQRENNSEEGAEDHEYEEISFGDERPKWAGSDPVYSSVGAHYPYRDGDGVPRRRTSPKNGFDSSDASTGVGIYGQVNKPRRRKHYLSQEAPPAPPSARRYGAITRGGGDSAVSSRDYRVPMMVPRISDVDTDDDSLVHRPVAPPRVRRQYISTSFSDKHGANVDRRVLPGASNVAQSGFYSSKPQTTILKVNAGYGNNNAVEEEEEETGAPPVPVKTKDAYVPLLDKAGKVASGAQVLPSSRNLKEEDRAANAVATSRSYNSNILFGKKRFNKIQTSLFSKLGLKSDKDSDTSSNGSGGVSPNITRKVNLTTDMEYSHRFDKQPKASRDPPAHWKVTTA